MLAYLYQCRQLHWQRFGILKLRPSEAQRPAGRATGNAYRHNPFAQTSSHPVHGIAVRNHDRAGILSSAWKLRPPLYGSLRRGSERLRDRLTALSIQERGKKMTLKKTLRFQAEFTNSEHHFFMIIRLRIFCDGAIAVRVGPAQPEESETLHTPTF
jgi:hypothetical protein